MNPSTYLVKAVDLILFPLHRFHYFEKLLCKRVLSIHTHVTMGFEKARSLYGELENDAPQSRSTISNLHAPTLNAIPQHSPTHSSRLEAHPTSIASSSSSRQRALLIPNVNHTKTSFCIYFQELRCYFPSAAPPPLPISELKAFLHASNANTHASHSFDEKQLAWLHAHKFDSILFSPLPPPPRQIDL